MNKLINRELAPQSWRGYSLDELRYRRVLNEVAIEIEKDRIKRQINGSLPKNEAGSSMFSRAIGALTYMDYVIIAFKLMTRLNKLYRAWKK